MATEGRVESFLPSAVFIFQLFMERFNLETYYKQCVL